jgi:hypothetical protein
MIVAINSYCALTGDLYCGIRLERQQHVVTRRIAHAEQRSHATLDLERDQPVLDAQ